MSDSHVGTRIVKLFLLAGIVALLATILLASPAEAEHASFRYKWPYLPGVTPAVTNTPFSGNHACGGGGSCTDAWDLVIGGDQIISSVEGTAFEVVSSFTNGTCGPGLGLGNNVKVSNPNGPTVYYAHLASTSIIQNSRVIQGDLIGIQGNTGYTIGSDPGGCGTHLHFEFVGGGGHPAEIDGLSSPGASTNSAVGAFNAPGAAIRAVYVYLGSLLNPDNSWEALGWTADWTEDLQEGPQAGCPPNSFCRLYIHYVPDPVQGHRGSTQVFRKHPGAVVFDDSAIMVGRWAVNDAYLVQNPFFEAWLGGFLAIGIPLTNQIGSDPDLCFMLGCTGYQRFSHGYIWSNSSGVQAPVFCPDVAGSGSIPGNPGAWPDHVVDLPNDILSVIQAFQLNDTAEPYEPWDNARLDLNGDGVIDLPYDILGVILYFNMQCFPGGRPPSE